jgi:hypothetical protein
MASEDELVRDFSKAVEQQTAAFFLGAGMSRQSGYVDWKELLRQVAIDIDLDVDRESDLIALAQYHQNAKGGRGKLNQLLIEEFTRDACLTDNHRLIANLPVHTVWTTNYDDLIERAFRDAQKRVDVKADPKTLALTLPGRAATVYKVHGDVSNPADAVLTKEDYELFDVKRRLFSVKLQGDLVSRTFLFLGYSLNDPNIDYILARIRVLLDQDVRHHYCVMKRAAVPKGVKGAARANYEYEVRKQEHRIQDLRRYGIQTVLIDDYSAITEILQRINDRVHLQDVFVSGSAHTYEPFGEERMRDLCTGLGRGIIEHSQNLVSGYGLGIGGWVVYGAFNALAVNDPDRLILRPFPRQEVPNVDKKALYTEYREQMIAQAGFCVFVCGNRLKEGYSSGEAHCRQSW